MTGRPRSVLVLGGGSAGWIAANLFQHRWGGLGTRVALVESSDIGIIGVGEGSTPQLKAFFDTLGIAEAEWMPRCNATYKAGIGFEGWSPRPGFERYFHPFPTSADSLTARRFFYNTLARRTGRDVPAHPDGFLLNSRIAREGRAPVGGSGDIRASYGYHFDAYLLGAFLREIGEARGIRRHDARIVSAERSASGDIAALLADDGRRFEADLFVDASGFRAILVEQLLGEPYRSYSDCLFNDRAAVIATDSDGPAVPAWTRATALSAGWAWRIPLTSRVGNGYVYSSRYIDDEAAAAELRSHLGRPPDCEVRRIAMRVGRVERSWARNCLAVGLAQGFLEPLEATALHIVLATVEGFIAAIDEQGMTVAARRAFNADIARRYDGIRDYLVCHYRTAGRGDSDYWRDCSALETLSDSLKAIITAWFSGRDLEQEVLDQDIAGYYSPLSWHCMLAGYGNFPGRLSPPGPDIRPVDTGAIEKELARQAAAFPPHSEALGLLENAA